MESQIPGRTSREQSTGQPDYLPHRQALLFSFPSDTPGGDMHRLSNPFITENRQHQISSRQNLLIAESSFSALIWIYLG